MIFSNQKYDVIIIGGGVAGLFCGSFLAGMGYKTAILEAHYLVGGCAQGFKRKGYSFDAGAHLIGSTNDKAIFSRLMRAAGVDLAFIKASPMDRIHFSDRTVLIPNDWSLYKEGLTANFPSESEGISILFREIERIVRFFGKQDIKMRYGRLPFKDFIETYVQDNTLRNILCAQWGFIGAPPSEVSTLSMAMMLVSYIRDGAGYVPGGAQKLCNQLATAFEKRGGRLFLSNKVENILVRDNVMVGVFTSKGLALEASSFVSTISPQHILDACSDAHVNPTLRNLIRDTKLSFRIYRLYLGLGMSQSRLRGLSGWHFSGKHSDDLGGWIYISSPSEYDPSLSPPEKCSIEVSFPFISDPLLEGASSSARRSLMKERALSFLENKIIKVKDYIEVIEDGTPETFRKYTSNPGGSIYGWDMSTSNFLNRKLVVESPIFRNLFSAGHWSDPGPGVVSAAISARLCSNSVRDNFLSRGAYKPPVSV